MEPKETDTLLPAPKYRAEPEFYINKNIERNSAFKIFIFLLKLFFFSAFAVGVFYGEIYFREPLYEASIPMIKSLQGFFSNQGIMVLRYLSQVDLYIIPMLISLYMISSLNVSFALVFSYVLTNYIAYILKMYFKHYRPFWAEREIHPYSCMLGYGNPAGHIANMTNYLLCFWQLSTDNSFCRKRLWIVVVIFFGITISILVLSISKLVLGVNALNQIIYGFLIGLLSFVFVFYILSIQTLRYRAFEKLFTKCCYIFLFSIFFIVLILLSLTFFFLFPDDVPEEISNYIESLCPDVLMYQKYSNFSIMNEFFLFFLIGAYYGLAFVLNLLNDKFSCKSIMNFNAFKCPEYFYFIIIFNSMGSVWFFYLTSTIGKDFDLSIICLIKVILPSTILGFVLFGLTPYFIFRCGIKRDSFDLAPNEFSSDDMWDTSD